MLKKNTLLSNSRLVNPKSGRRIKRGRRLYTELIRSKVLDVNDTLMSSTLKRERQKGRDKKI